MYLQSLKLLQPIVKEMHLQENTFFDRVLDPKVNVAQNVAQCPLHHMTYVVTTSKGLGGDAFTENTLLDLRIKVTRNFFHALSTSCDLFSYKVLELPRQKV